MAVQAIYHPAPAACPPPRNPQEAKQQAAAYERGKALFDQGYVAVFFTAVGKPTGLCRIGLHPKLQREALEQEAHEAEMEYTAYRASLEEHDILPVGGPYIVNLVIPYCSCPSFGAQYRQVKGSLKLVQNKRYCKHFLALTWALTQNYYIAASGRLHLIKEAS